MDQNHHYVPEFLQKAWTGSDGKLQVFRLDFEHLPTKRYTPDATAFDENLFALTRPFVGGYDKQVIESRILRDVDNLGAKMRERLVKGETEFSYAERVQWATLLMSLRLRRPETIHRLRSAAPEMLRRELASNPEEYERIRASTERPLPQTAEELLESLVPGFIENVGLMRLFPRYLSDSSRREQIAGMNWAVLDFSSADVELLLSDRPCAIVPHLDDPRCYLTLPISPTKAFVATHGVEAVRELQARPLAWVARVLNEQSVIDARPRVYARDQRMRQLILESRARFRS